MYNLENHRGFCVVMVIECSVASGEMEFGGGVGGGVAERKGGGMDGCEWEEGCYLNCFP